MKSQNEDKVFNTYYTDNIINKMNESHNKLKNKIKEIDDKFLKQKNKVDLTKYYRYLQKTNVLTDYAYSTTIFLDNKYMPGILNWGFNLKNVIKTPYNLICLVQDRPYYEIDNSGNSFMKFPGLNENEINDIKKIFDVVIGIDVLSNKSNNNVLENRIEYKHIFYYCTKFLCLGLTDYKKIIYIDSSAFINLSIDTIFDEIKQSTYYNIFLRKNSLRGLVSNYYLFIPQDYYLEKGLFIIQNYLSLFDNYINTFSFDEDIIYYTIYPHWGTKLLDDLSYYPTYVNIQHNINTNYHIFSNMRHKPFRFSLIDKENRFLFNNSFIIYNNWDLVVKKLLISYPELSKYFQFIKTYRITLF